MRIVRRRFIVGFALVAIAAVTGSFAIASMSRTADAPTRVAIAATPIVSFDNRDPERTRFGALEFRGGLALTSSFAPFGGLSAIHVEPDGSRFLAVTDRASWLRGRIVYRDGRPDGIADAEMAPILGYDGKPLAARGWPDVESLTESGGRFYAGIERVERVLSFDMRRDGLTARGRPVATPPDFKTFAHNKGLECLTSPPKGFPLAGRLIAIAERSLDAAGHHRGFVLAGGSGGGAVARFGVTRSKDFDITDCAVLPPGDLLLLERHYSPLRGVAMRIRRVPLARIEDGAVIDGTILIEAGLGYQIDNMEGLSVTRNARGEIVLTLVSDDNFSAIQRSLLLQFVLVEE